MYRIIRLFFSCNIDLWIAPLAGGSAMRITLKTGHKTYPKFSPDGSRIAFTADYNRKKSVYVMGTNGTGLKRLTYNPSENIIQVIYVKENS